MEHKTERGFGSLASDPEVFSWYGSTSSWTTPRSSSSSACGRGSGGRRARGAAW
ncbi:MAG: hypothetical protein H6Q81_2642 [Deltaproteobacteria bacterium]|nr:hypothetical protein [Deltaproteobacteria bacterium]